MSATNKPADFPIWATTPELGKLAAPTVPKQEKGWIDEKPPLQWFNWWMNLVYLWISYFDNRMDSALSQFDAVVGSGAYATHASLSAVLLDANIANIKNILVIDHPVIDATIVLNQANVRIEFKRSATLTKGAAATCLQISENGCEILGAKFSGFSAVGNKAVEILATKKNNLVFGCRFFDCVTDIEDNGDNNTLQANIVEV